MADEPATEKRKKAKSRGKLKRAVAGVAPGLARALGGPLAGAAAEALAQAVFGDDALSGPVDEDRLAAAIEKGGPAFVAAAQEAERNFLIALRQADLEEARIASDDRADARARQAALDDWTPSVLGGLIIGGFFIVLATMVARRLPAGAETEFSIMLGALATMTAAVVNYFFGSSAGSREKTRLLSPEAERRLQGRADGTAAAHPREAARAALFDADHDAGRDAN